MRKLLLLLGNKSKLLVLFLGLVGLLFLTQSSVLASADGDEDDWTEEGCYVAQESVDAGMPSSYKQEQVHPRKTHFVYRRRTVSQIFLKGPAANAYCGPAYTGAAAEIPGVPDTRTPRPYYYIALYRCALF